MNESINTRIKRIRNDFCEGSNVNFANRMGKQPNTTSNWVREGYNVGRGVASEIAEKFSVDKNWLLTGVGGPEPKSRTVNSDTDSPYTVPLLPLSAQGGSLNDFVIAVKGSDCEQIVSPVKGADFAMTVAGDSMTPEYPSGAQILIKKINERAFIDWGRVYVLDTCNGSVVKKVLPSDDPTKVKCVSINPAYPPFDVSLDDVFGVYRVLLCMSAK